jgi:hypothetical protein
MPAASSFVVNSPIGTFDGIFLIGIVAVLLASIPRSRDTAPRKE